MRVFPHANQSTVTGCTAHPVHEKKCFMHRQGWDAGCYIAKIIQFKGKMKVTQINLLAMIIAVTITTIAMTHRSFVNDATTTAKSSFVIINTSTYHPCQ